jgi:hypothetical protein
MQPVASNSTKRSNIMDYHAWIILEKSLGVLDYGNIYNRAIANPPRSFWLAAAAKRLWVSFKARLEHGKKERDVRNGTQNDGHCHAC